MSTCNVCKIGPDVKGHSCRRDENGLEIKCETCNEWFLFTGYFIHPCKVKVMRPEDDVKPKDEKPLPVCPTCQKPILHTQKIHDEVHHGAIPNLGTPLVDCSFCGMSTVDYPNHYGLFHQGEIPLRLNNRETKFLRCPFTGTCSGVSTIAMELHLKTTHKIEDCKCGVAMTSPQFHKCGYDVRSYCYVCATWIHGCDRFRYAKHLETHMSKRNNGYKECPVCHGYFHAYDIREYNHHSCGEVRRGKKGIKSMLCGKCMESMDSYQELHEHFLKTHWAPTTAPKMTQSEIDFQAAKKDLTKFPCENCRTIFTDGFTYSEHSCGAEVQGRKQNSLKIVSDVASILAKIGKPDEKGIVDVIQCSICGNRFHAVETYDSHACKMKGHDKKRVALLVSPDREDKSHMDRAIKEYGGEVILYTRGIPSEEYIEAEFRKAGATVIKISNDNPARRDATMIQQADICLLFPSKKSQKSFAVVKTKITSMGAKVDAVSYPDNLYIDVSLAPTEHKQQPGGICSCGRVPCLEVPKTAETVKQN